MKILNQGDLGRSLRFLAELINPNIQDQHIAHISAICRDHKVEAAPLTCP